MGKISGTENGIAGMFNGGFIRLLLGGETSR